MKNKEEKNKNKLETNDYLEKIKENNKLFEEKMVSLNKKKIKVIKSNDKKNKKIKNLSLLIKKEIEINYNKTKKNITNKYIIENENQITIINNNKPKDKSNIITKSKKTDEELIIDNCIYFDYISKNIKNYSEEEQDIYFISKIRQLQKDNKFKTDLIIDLQNKLKQKDDKFIKITKIEMDELNEKVKNISNEKEEKIKELQKLETDIYNLKKIIENLENQINNYKNENQIKIEEINNLNNIIEKYKNDENIYEQRINNLEAMNKSSFQDYDILKADLNKIKEEKEKMENIIEEQKIKMDNYRKHINTLRKFICEDDKIYDVNKINEKIITKNNEIIYKNSNNENNKSIEEKKDNNKDEKNNKDDINKNLINGNENGNNAYNIYIKNVIDDENNNKEIITSYQYTKKHRKTNSAIINNIDNEIFQINKRTNVHSKNKSINKRKEIAITSLRKRINRNIDNYENKDIYYKTYNNFNDLNNSSDINKNEKEKNDKNNENNDDNFLTYFPSEKYLIERKEEINKLETELDLLYKEKNNLENEIIKLPQHPKTLKEIKDKRALNDKIALNESNINKVRIKIRKIKEV